MKAVITGITGQDGSYLAEFLLSRGYDVHGTVRPSASSRLDRIHPILHRLHLHEADLLDQMSLIHLLADVSPDEVYNLAGHVESEAGWQHPLMCAEVDALGTVRLLEAIRLVNPDIRFFQASSSEIFGQAIDSPQTERTEFHPRSPLGSAKAYAHRMTVAYRQRYGLKAGCGILFEHESPRRRRRAITRRITDGVARIKLGLQEKLVLSNLDLSRDRGFAGDYVRAFWMMLQHPSPDDYIIATGRMHSLEDFCKSAFSAVDLDWCDYVQVEPSSPPTPPSIALQGDASHARRTLLWEPEVSFREMIRMMVEADLERYSPKNRLQTDVLAETLLQENCL